MGARFVFAVILLNGLAAHEDAPTKGVYYEETTQSVDVESKTEPSKEITRNEDLGKILDNILFKPYIPEDESYEAEPINTKAPQNFKVNNDSYILTKPEKKSHNLTSYPNTADDANKDEKLGTVDSDPMKSDSSDNIEVTSQPFAKYEITENVIDIPDDRTPAGPIVPDYTPYRNTPLNMGAPKNITDVTKNSIDEKGDEDEVNSNSKGSRISILHINAEFDGKPDNTHQSKISTFFNGVKEYISGIKTGVVKGINKLFRKDKSASDSTDADFSKEEFDDFSKEFDDSHERKHVIHEDDDDDDFSELHHTIHKGFT